MAIFAFSLGAIGVVHAHRLRHAEVTLYASHYWPSLEGVLFCRWVECHSLHHCSTISMDSRPAVW